MLLLLLFLTLSKSVDVIIIPIIDDGGVLEMVDEEGRRFMCSYCSHSSRHTRADIREGLSSPVVTLATWY